MGPNAFSLTASVGLEEASRTFWDVAVVGAGPAGALAARELARRGAAVLLVDKAQFPREKVCGACLNGSALATLHQVGLGNLPARLGAIPLRSMVLCASGGRAEIALPAGASLARGTLDAALVQEAIAARAAFLPRTCAEVGGVTPDARWLTLRQEERAAQVTARLVLAADGLGSPCLRNQPGFRIRAQRGSWIGAGTALASPEPFFQPGSIFMACGEDGYVGAVRLEDGRLNVAAALDPVAVKAAGGPAGPAARIMELAAWPSLPGLSQAVWRGTPALTRRASRCALPRVLLLGDAAGYVEPFTGEGIAWALASGAAAAPLAAQALRNPDFDLEDAWERLHYQLLGACQARCRRITRLLRFPGLVRAALAVLAVVPGLATPVINRLNGSLPRGGRRPALLARS